jgi:hypothetical protein
MIVAVTLRLLYLIFQQVLGLLLLIGRTACGCPKPRALLLTWCFAADGGAA